MPRFLNIAFVFTVFFLINDTKPVSKKTYSEIKYWYKNNKGEPITFFNSDQNQLEFNRSVIQIILIRHGHPNISKNGWYSYNHARNFIITYDTIGVHSINKPPVELRSNEDVVIYCSTLDRAYDTAQKIFDKGEIIKTDSIFIEFQREIIPLPLIWLPINGWTRLSRFFWVLGLHSSQIPSFRMEKSRAKYDSQFLEVAATENKKVILVAHGFLNKYIVKYLEKNGWDQSYNGGNDYLAVQVMTKIIDE